MQFQRRLRLFFYVVAIVVVLVGMKLAVHRFGLEFLSLDPLFSSIVAGTIFIIGFLLSSTLPDFKEAERLPADIRVAMEAIHDDVESFAHQESRVDMARLRAELLDILSALERGLEPEGHHAHLEDAIARVDALLPFISELSKLGLPPNAIVRIRASLDALRRSLYRISYIQKIDFVPSVSILIRTLVAAVLFLLVCLKTDGSVGEAMIFGFVSYLFVFALHLIAVFEQPFRQGEHSVDKVSLYLLRDFAGKLTARN